MHLVSLAMWSFYLYVSSKSLPAPNIQSESLPAPNIQSKSSQHKHSYIKKRVNSI